MSIPTTECKWGLCDASKSDLRTHRVPQDQPRVFLATCRIEIKHKAADGESRVYWRWRDSPGTECVGDSERKGGRLSILLGVRVFTEDCSLVYASSQASRNHLEQSQEPRYYFLEPVVWNTYDGFIRSFLPGPSLGVTYLK